MIHGKKKIKKERKKERFESFSLNLIGYRSSRYFAIIKRDQMKKGKKDSIVLNEVRATSGIVIMTI